MEIVRPFVKWAGGKGGLISQFEKFYPFDLENGVIYRYIEPFIGGGAVLIDILQKYNINEVFAKRMINANSKGRGEISELLITNYKEMIGCIQVNSTMKMVVSN